MSNTKLTAVSAVLLQAMKQDPPADTKCRDKFLVQSVPISGDLEFSNVQTIVSRSWLFGHHWAHVQILTKRYRSGSLLRSRRYKRRR